MEKKERDELETVLKIVDSIAQAHVKSEQVATISVWQAHDFTIVNSPIEEWIGTLENCRVYFEEREHYEMCEWVMDLTIDIFENTISPKNI